MKSRPSQGGHRPPEGDGDPWWAIVIAVLFLVLAIWVRALVLI